MLPLHSEAQSLNQREKCPETAHAGLWYDRFFSYYDKDWNIPADDEQEKIKGKTAWVNTVAGLVGNRSKLEAYNKQQHALLKTLEAPSPLVMSTDWHFVTGLGNNHPVENGFAWHHTLGVPYLTGAAVKGMVRAWCEVWEGMDDESMIQWFGPTMEDIKKKRAEKACVGELIFFDAVPAAPVKLKADIMTPHYGKWYSDGASNPDTPETIPADWYDPNPVPFLVVDKGASFQFAVAKRVKDSSIDLSEVMKTLREALEWIGAGAKTAAGYGRFSESIEAKRQREREQKEAVRLKQEKQAQVKAVQAAQELGLSGLAAEMHSYASQVGWKDDKGMFIREAPDWLEKIEALDGDARRQAASELAKYLEVHDKGILANPNKTKGKKNKHVYKPNSIKLAEALNKALGS
jgi:CRISPR-associated protein Cmr6